MMLWPLPRTTLTLLTIITLLQLATVVKSYLLLQPKPTRCGCNAFRRVDTADRISTHRRMTTTFTSTTSLRSFNDEDDGEATTDAPKKELRFGPFGSLDVLVIAVSLFFVATVALVGKDALLATPTTETLQQIKVVDADEVLRSDFLRNENSVPF